ncbi:hypothetical protein ACFY94_07190 [Streptomyces griseorubiginosus]|uniref:hypothetical protein n=1 Tax=Streptomyces TaxID=1883 RepID=UPI002FF1C31B
MAQAVPHLVNRLVIDTEDTFDTVRRRYESLVPAIDFPGLLEAIATGDPARMQAHTADHTPHSFANVPSKPGPDSPQQPTTVADHILGFLNSCPPPTTQNSKD